jgi:hypothetical protein
MSRRWFFLYKNAYTTYNAAKYIAVSLLTNAKNNMHANKKRYRTDSTGFLRMNNPIMPKKKKSKS